MKSDNNWYGHRSIFSRYVGLKDQPSFSTIQHGYLNKFYLEKKISTPKLKFIPYLCWNEEVKKRLDKIGYNKTFIVGAPFIYLSKILNKNKNKKKKLKKKLIFFPPHNTVDHFVQDLNYQKLITRVKTKYKIKNFTVCLYYADFENKNIRNVLKKNKIKFKSLVSRNDQNSLLKLYKELDSSTHVLTCDISSVLFYSMFLKKKVGVLIKNNSESYLTTKVKNDEKFIFYYKKKFPKLFNGFLDPSISYEIACKNLGLNHLKSKKQLIEILGWNSKIKKLTSKILTFYYDIKYGKEFRLGKKKHINP